ncbi:MAG: DUF1080 domain-containing protein [Opitutaceae bacterium]|nr:DUF1080 domain-containing protein [Opitutaceae bacterium]
MKHSFATLPRNLLLALSPVLLVLPSRAASTSQAFYGDPPDDFHPWAVHDRNRLQPQRVVPGTPGTQQSPGRPPSDAVVLFDGTEASLANWISDKPEGGPIKWALKEGALEVVPKTGYIRTRREFGDVQLHVEWASPTVIKGEGQGRGNSGIFLHGLVEVQVLDNNNNPTYADGFAASVYGVNPAMANALRPTGEFQFIDIVFRRPIYVGDILVDPGYVTVFCNGVLVQDHTPLEGPTGHIKRTHSKPFPEKGPLRLQDHGDLVRFRNIWIRELPPRPQAGATDFAYTAIETAAKRAEIAESIRNDGARLAAGSNARMLRLAESLVYAPDADTRKEVEALASAYVESIVRLSGDALEAKKDEVTGVLKALQYLAKCAALSPDFEPRVTLEKVSLAAGWEDAKKK